MTARSKQGKEIHNKAIRPFMYVRRPDGSYLEVMWDRAEDIVHHAINAAPEDLAEAVKGAIEHGAKS